METVDEHGVAAVEESGGGTSYSVEGIKCPKCDKVFSNEMGLRMHDIRKHQPGGGWNTTRNFGKRKYHAKGGGKPWTPEQRAKFEKTWRSKRRKQQVMRKGPIQIVYPKPVASIEEAIRNTWSDEEAAAVHIPKLKHCPECGAHIEGWRYQS